MLKPFCFFDMNPGGRPAAQLRPVGGGVQGLRRRLRCGSLTASRPCRRPRAGVDIPATADTGSVLANGCCATNGVHTNGVSNGVH